MRVQCRGVRGTERGDEMVRRLPEHVSKEVILNVRDIKININFTEHRVLSKC